MAKINESILNLDNDYLFSEITEKTEKFEKENPDKKVIKLGIGDVSLPLVNSVIEAMHNAVDEMSKKETFRGYGKVQGESSLIEKILKYEYSKRGIEFSKEEIFIASGTKGDLAGIIELLSVDNKVAITDPVYPAYVDANKLLGRKEIVFLEAKEENNFKPELPKEHLTPVKPANLEKLLNSIATSFAPSIS